jgi:hypothetical protein
MPNETAQAVAAALEQGAPEPSEIVDKVREWFNTNGVEYSTFDYGMLIPFMSAAETQADEPVAE